jgi:uncharacterized protein YkwD
MRSRHLALAVGVAALLVAPAAGLASKRCATAEMDPATSGEVIALANAHRADMGLGGFTENVKLRTAASTHAIAMARSGRLYHTDITEWAGNRSAAQNIGAGPSAAVVFQAMLDSPPHREALETAKYRWMGVGGAEGCDGALRVSVNMMAGRSAG